ncbi:DUF3000 domain-containing protein [Canibacter oris]|uniref:DUF3000 domain-containing protein n=1 Tax=Canibacter oris TaxID=1365628 RepID=A0A840DK97_9MICO|nr:hypothetical protein [Canibacter oris]
MTISFTSEPRAFQTAAAAVRGAKLRAELDFKEIPAPDRIAPHAIALGASVNPSGRGVSGAAAAIDGGAGAGRLILLHDPKMAAEWGNEFRFVCYAQADIEVEIGADPLLADVAWSWLIDALHTRQTSYTAIAGTATKTLSTGYGSLAQQGTGAQLQLRASWTPTDADYATHVQAWSELLCLLAGLPQHEGVAAFNPRTPADVAQNSGSRPAPVA